MNYNQFNNNPNPRHFRSGGFRIGPGKPPPFIKAMIFVNVGVFLLQFVFGGTMTNLLGLTPARFFAEFPNLIYQIFTYMFLHSPHSFGHILFNMFALWMFGTEIEHAWGSKSFARFYIMAGIAGAVLTLIIASSQPIPMIGASGAIYGILVAYWCMFPNRSVYLYFLFPVKVKWFVPGMMLLGFLFSGGNIAHWAHLGGALWGLVYLKADWRTKWFNNKFKGLRHKRKQAKLNKNVQKAGEVMKRVDAILDKINEVGIENISPEDLRFLEEASSKLSKEDNHAK
jgi:membrane associated rhomboid family serine protease